MAFSAPANGITQSGGTTGQVQATFPGATTAGRLLIAVVTGAGTPANAITIPGWTEQVSVGIQSTVASVAILTKIADGTESVVTASKTGGGVGMQMHIYEVAGNAATATADHTSNATTAGSTATSVLSGTANAKAFGALWIFAWAQSNTNGGGTAVLNSVGGAGTLLNANATSKLIVAYRIGPAGVLAGENFGGWTTLRTASGIAAVFPVADWSASAAETGAATDAELTLVASSTDTEAPTATEAESSLAAATADTESGTATETESALSTPASAAETGAATDTEASTTASADADSGIVVDTEFGTTAVTDNDGVLIDDAHAMTTQTLDGDAASAVEAEAFALALLDDDSAISSENEAFALSLTDTESAVAMEAENWLAAMLDGDTASAVEDEDWIFTGGGGSAGWLIGAIPI